MHHEKYYGSYAGNPEEIQQSINRRIDFIQNMTDEELKAYDELQNRASAYWDYALRVHFKGEQVDAQKLPETN